MKHTNKRASQNDVDAVRQTLCLIEFATHVCESDLQSGLSRNEARESERLNSPGVVADVVKHHRLIEKLLVASGVFNLKFEEIDLLDIKFKKTVLKHDIIFKAIHIYSQVGFEKRLVYKLL